VEIYCVQRSGLLDVQNILSVDTRVPRQTEGHSFGIHLISESVRVTPSCDIEASIVLFMTRVSEWPISLRSQHPMGLHLNYVQKSSNKTVNITYLNN
jgi:hypothetical protein